MEVSGHHQAPSTLPAGNNPRCSLQAGWARELVVSFSGKDRNLLPLPGWWSYQISRNCVTRFRCYWKAEMRTWYGVCLAFIVQRNWAKYFFRCRVIARHVLVYTGCVNGAGFCLCTYDRWNIAYYDTCLEMYALRKRKIPHSLVHTPTIANGCVVRIMNRSFNRNRHHQRSHGLDTPGHKTCRVSSCRSGVMFPQQHEVIQNGYALTLRMVQWFSRMPHGTPLDGGCKIKQILISSYKFRSYVINKL